MKSFKSTCEDNITHPLYEVSILADIDDQINAYDNSIKDRIEKWIKENYECIELKISKKPNKNGLYEATACSVIVKNRNITSLANEMFEWVKVKYFNCSYCSSLTSLEGAPKEVERNFSCHKCTALKSLVGAPEKVGGNFDCWECKNLSSLVGAPEKVGGDFGCQQCTELKSLEGAPKEVGGDFFCSYCDSLVSLKGDIKKVGQDFYCAHCASLESLEGAPKEVGRIFRCYNCKINFTEVDVKKVSNVKGKIFIK